MKNIFYFIYIFLILLLLSFFYSIYKTKTFAEYTFWEKLYLQNKLSYFVNKNLENNKYLNNTVLLQNFIDQNQFQSPDANRLFMLALTTRSDMYTFGIIKNEQDIDCVDNLTIQYLFKKDDLVISCKNQDKINFSLKKFDKYLETFGEIPKQPQSKEFWSGVNPLFPEVSNWLMTVKELSLEDIPKPFDYNSKEEKEEIQKILDAQNKRTEEEIKVSKYWASSKGTLSLWFIELDKIYKNRNAEEMLKIKTLTSIAGYNSFLQTWKYKYIYWTPRPIMRNSAIKTSIPTPNFPAYPSGHTSISSTISETLKKCIDVEHSSELNTLVNKVAFSRFSSGIHFEFDNIGGVILGQKLSENIADKYCTK